jgi:hypothetical protein
VNIIIICLIINEMSKSEQINSINSLSRQRINTFVLLGCLLFSGIGWIGLPFSLISFRNDIIYPIVWLFSVVNALQGVFIFIHFIFTTRLLLKQYDSNSKFKKNDDNSNFTRDYSIENSFKRNQRKSTYYSNSTDSEN